jgi:hypothetical protein
MGLYDGWSQAQLQAACKDRELSAGGSNAEMTARLEEFDANQLLGGDEPKPASAQPDPPAEGAADALARADEASDRDDELHMATAPPPVDPPKGNGLQTRVASEQNLYRIAFSCPSELSTGLHEDFRLRAYNQAIEAGKTPRGGLAGVHRTGFSVINGVRHAIYAVSLRR